MVTIVDHALPEHWETRDPEGFEDLAEMADQGDVSKSLVYQTTRMRTRVAVPRIMFEPLVKFDFTLALQNGFRSLVKSKETWKGMRWSETFLNAVAAHPGVESHYDMLPVTRAS